MKNKLSRRDFLRLFKGTIASLFTLGTASYAYGVWGEPEWIEVNNIDLPLRRLPKSFYDFRLVQISDIHIGGWMNRERIARVIELTIKEKPDLVVITGDHVFGHSWTAELDDAVEDYIEEMSKLTAECLVLGVLGNHDHWTDAEKVRQMLSRCNAMELKNDIFTLEKDGEQLHIAGVDDIWEGHDRLDEVLAKLPESGEAILLAHEPDYADTSAKTGRFSVQLSGHSHGGQVVIPFFGAPVLPHLGRKYYSGLYKVRKMWQYTNRGVGMIEPAIRFNCRPEITVFTLKPV